MVAVGRSNPTGGNFLVSLFFRNFFVWQIFCQFFCQKNLSWKTEYHDLSKWLKLSNPYTFATTRYIQITEVANSLSAVDPRCKTVCDHLMYVKQSSLDLFDNWISYFINFIFRISYLITNWTNAASSKVSTLDKVYLFFNITDWKTPIESNGQYVLACPREVTSSNKTWFCGT